MASIGTITTIPTGTTVKRTTGQALKVDDTVEEGERLDITNPSPNFTIAWRQRLSASVAHAEGARHST